MLKRYAAAAAAESDEIVSAGTAGDVDDPAPDA